jgi:rhodanese-related sulfurtransferase
MLCRALCRRLFSATMVVVAISSLSEAWQAASGGDSSPEISTEQLTSILETRSATVIDARPFLEFAISHIPGALNVAAKPGVSPSLYISDVAEIGRLVRGNRAAPLVLYCNGPHCGTSKRLAAELQDAGYSNVRRYQLGIPS